MIIDSKNKVDLAIIEIVTKINVIIKRLKLALDCEATTEVLNGINKLELEYNSLLQKLTKIIGNELVFNGDYLNYFDYISSPKLIKIK